MTDEALTTYTASFRPGGKDYDSPLLVVRATDERDLIVRLGGNPDLYDLGDAVAEYHAKLRKKFEEVNQPAAPPAAPPPATPIWSTAATNTNVATNPLTPNPDGTYPPCPHGTRNRKPWTSPKNGKVYLFCTLDRGAPGACPTVTL